MSQLFFGWAANIFPTPALAIFRAFFLYYFNAKIVEPGSRVPCAAVLRIGEGHKPTANIACDINEAKNREKT